MLQHVGGHETQGKRSRARANTEPHSCNETAPMQRCPPLPARIGARNRPQLFPTPCYSTCAATIHEENIPRRVLIRNRIHATKLHPCNGALRSQHVSGHETGPNRSPHRAAARERLRFTRESFPAACWMKMKPHPCNETAPMQRTHLNRSPARPRARTRP